MVQGAVYDAVNAIDRRHQPYLLDVDALDIDPSASYGAAIATAAHHVLVAIVPAGQVGALDSAYATTLAGIPDGPAEDEGVTAGEAAAAAMLDARTGDGFLAPFDFTTVIGPGPGAWRPVTPTALDPDPWVGNLRPFVIESPSQFRSEGPNSVTSTAYTADFNEVKELGSLTSTTRTADQTYAAIFWQTSPIGLWNGLSRDLSSARGLDAVDEARLLVRPEVLAAHGCDPGSRHRREPGHARRPRVEAAVRPVDADQPGPRQSAVPRPPVGSRLHQRFRAQHDAGLLRHRQDQLRRVLEPIPGPAPPLRPALNRAEGDHRRAGVGRDPLPHRRRAGNGDREEGGALDPHAPVRDGRLTDV